MKNRARMAGWLGIALLSARVLCAADGVPPIQKIEIGENAEFRVNGQPFLPLMIWLQSDARIPQGLSIGVNTFVANGGTLDSKAYLDALAANGLYGVLHFDGQIIAHPHLLGWIHGDEPDLPQTVIDAQVTAGEGMRLNPSTPLARIVDGVPHSWSVLDPLQDAEATVHLKQPATIQSIAVWLTISSGLAVAKEVSFCGDNGEICRATLENKKGEQRVSLEKPVTTSSLTMRVLSTFPGEQVWGSVGEIAAYDAGGANVLLSPPRSVPRSTPEDIADTYRNIKRSDPTRPVFVTFTANFMQEFEKYDPATKAGLYPEFVKHCDVAGFDVYPIFGWNKPEWLDRVAGGVGQLRSMAGPQRPIYAWIETNRGSRWVTPERQIEVRPQDTRAEVWMAVIRGATAIGYFTHRWVPDYKQFAPQGEMVAELRRLNGQLTRLAPALLARPAGVDVRMTMSDDLTSHFKATLLGDRLYIFAQNIDMQRRAGTARWSVEGLSGETEIEVLDENRTLLAERGEFSDEFAPLAEHVYCIRPGNRVGK